MDHVELAEKYAVRLIQNLDTEALADLAFVYLVNQYTENYTLEELTSEVKDNVPDLLEE